MSGETKPNIFPGLRYKEAAAAIDWLVRAFGFEKQMVATGPDDTIAHAQIKLGPGVVMLGSTRDDDLRLASPRDLGATTASVYIYVKDIDAHYDRARAAGAEIVRELADMEYGSREYTARDLEGHLWSFGTYLPEQSA